MIRSNDFIRSFRRSFRHSFRRSSNAKGARSNGFSHSVVYTSDSELRRPRQFARQMLTDLLAARELAWRLLVRNIQGQYRQPLLGYFWIILPSLATTLLWIFLNQSQILDVGETDIPIPYPVYVLVGTLLWQGFVDALNSPLQQLAASEGLLTKINFPKESIIMAGLGEVLFNSSIRMLLLLVVFLWFQIAVPSTILLAPIGILALLALGATLGLLLAPLGMLYPDVQRGINIMTPLWFFMTPVVYSPPTTWPAVLIAKLNPVSPLLVTTRELLTTGTVSQAGYFLLIVCLMPLLFIASWVLYRLAMPHLIVRMTAR